MKIKGVLKLYQDGVAKNGSQYKKISVGNIFGFFWNDVNKQPLIQEGDIIELQYEEKGNFKNVIGWTKIESKIDEIPFKQDILRLLRTNKNSMHYEQIVFFLKQKNISEDAILDVLDLMMARGDIIIDRPTGLISELK